MTEAATAMPLYTTTTNGVLLRATKQASALNFPVADSSHILLELSALTEDFSIHAPLRELGFDHDTVNGWMVDYGNVGYFEYRLQTPPHYEDALREAAHVASLRRNASSINLSDLTVGVFAGTSPIIHDILKALGLTQFTVMSVLGAPDEYILRFMEGPAE